MDKHEYEAWVMQAHLDDQEIRAGLSDVRGGLWRAAKALYHFTEATGWTALGYESLGEWLADPDITLTRPTYYRMMQSWQELAVLRGVDEDQLSKLDLAKTHITLPALKRGEVTVEEAISDSTTLGARDLREKYRGVAAFPLAPTDDEDEMNVPERPHYDGDEPPEGLEVVEAEAEELVARAMAETLTRVLESVYSELGDPNSKRMSKTLRDQVSYALMLAHQEGLGTVLDEVTYE